MFDYCDSMMKNDNGRWSRKNSLEGSRNSLNEEEEDDS